MGINVEELDDLKLLCLQNMKRNEICSFRVEEVGYDKVKSRRFLDSEYFLQFEIFDWETIIDVNGDFQCMKNLIKKGKGTDRMKETDEAIMSLILVAKHSEKALITKNFEEGEIAYDQLPKSVGELILYAKEGEESKIDVKLAYFEENETDKDFLSSLQAEVSDNSDDLYPFTLHIMITSIIANEDLFHDKTALKKRLFSSYSTSRPDLHSRIYFDF
jgi:hypothetical protein